MNYLFDTNVISELAKAEPHPKVAAWFAGIDLDKVHLSVITIGEIRKGIESLPDSRKRDRLTRWLEEDLCRAFEGRILPIDQKVAEAWGSMAAKAKRPLPAVDGLIAATAAVHRLKIVTRNTKDFEYAGVGVVDPWG